MRSPAQCGALDGVIHEWGEKMRSQIEAITVDLHSEHLNDYSSVVLCGKLIEKEAVGKDTVYRLQTTQSSGRSFVSKPSIFIVDPELVHPADQLPLKHRVYLEGYVNTREGKKKGHTQHFVARAIHLPKDDEPDENRIELVGSVRSATVVPENAIDFTLDVFFGNYMHHILFRYYVHEGDDYLAFMAYGTRLHIVGHCVAYDYGETKREYITADTIELANDAEPKKKKRIIRQS